jgi:hypothetical protein
MGNCLASAPLLCISLSLRACVEFEFNGTEKCKWSHGAGCIRYGVVCDNRRTQEALGKWKSLDKNGN